jgi:uroporphyrinogen-III synthase
MSDLAGKRIVITRATHQALALEILLRQHQAIPILYPCIAIVPPENTSQLDTQLVNLESFTWLILTSTNTVYALKERLNALNLHPGSQPHIAVVGHKTAQAFRNQFQHQPDFVPDKFTAESLAQSLPIEGHERIFVPQSALADQLLADMLRARGAEVTCVTAYETIIGDGGEHVPAMLQQGEIDVLTFTSSSTVKNFVRRIGPLPLPDIPALCIGSSTADTAKHIGFKQLIVPDENYTLHGMVDALIHYYELPSIKYS